MVDCHMHMVLDAVDWKAAVARHKNGVDEGFVRAILARWRDAGFVYLRSGGDKWGVSAVARQLAPEYGIRYRTPLAPISKRGHYGGFIGEQFSDMRQYAQMVAQRRIQGADFIKIMISGLMDFHRFGVLTQEGLPAGEIREMVHIAHEEGFCVMAHANGARVMEAAAAAGVDSVEHGAYADGDALAAMAENGVIWVPTLSTVGNLLGAYPPGSLTASHPPLGKGGFGCGRFDVGAVREILACAMDNVCRFARLGGLVASGSDAGAWAVPHAACTEDEWLRRAGVGDGVLEMGAKAVMERF